MQTPIQKAIEDIKGYKSFGKTIDIDFVVTVLNTYSKEEKKQIIDAANQIEFQDTDGYGIIETISKGEQYYQEKFKKD